MWTAQRQRHSEEQRSPGRCPSRWCNSSKRLCSGAPACTGDCTISICQLLKLTVPPVPFVPSILDTYQISRLSGPIGVPESPYGHVSNIPTAILVQAVQAVHSRRRIRLPVHRDREHGRPLSLDGISFVQPACPPQDTVEHGHPLPGTGWCYL